MTINKINIEGPLIIQPDVFKDERGFFFESYNYSKYSSNGLKTEFLQDNISKSQKNVLRGLHFQKPPYAQGKLIQVIQGAVWDVLVDIRKESATYGEHFGIELSEHNKTQFYIPPGFAHGFLTLEDETIFHYKCTNVFNKESEGSIIWNDSDLNINWNCKDPIISDKDKVAPLFKSFNSPF